MPKYDFILYPGADPSRIKIRYEGASDLQIDEAGKLHAKTEWGAVTENRPRIYQSVGAKDTEIQGRYRMVSPGVFGFEIEGEYDSRQPLIIDPALIYSTYFGGLYEDYANDAVVDGSGNLYVSRACSRHCLSFQ
jgi:hypothetical protein